MANPDRRRTQRISLQQAVSIVLGDGGYEVRAITENVSSGGVLLYSTQFIPEGTEVGVILTLPPTEPEAEWRPTWCFGRVLRVEKELKEEMFGTAIGFYRFEMLSEA